MFTLKDFTNNFKGYPEESINSFLDLASEVSFNKNEIIANTGEICREFYIIKSGVLRSFHIDEKGKEYTRSIFTTGKTTGSLGSLISGKPSVLTYECLSNCNLYKFDFKEFKSLSKNDHYILKLYSELLEYIFLMMETRIHELALLNATERYLKLKKEIPNIETLIPQYHIASYLNVSAVQLSRIRKEIYSK